MDVAGVYTNASYLYLQQQYAKCILPYIQKEITILKTAQVRI